MMHVSLNGATELADQIQTGENWSVLNEWQVDIDAAFEGLMSIIDKPSLSDGTSLVGEAVALLICAAKLRDRETFEPHEASEAAARVEIAACERMMLATLWLLKPEDVRELLTATSKHPILGSATTNTVAG